MQKSIEVRGKTTDDALAKGLAQLGLERDDVSVEIIERGKKGILGIGAVDAVVRLSYEAPEEVPVPKKPAPPRPAPAPEKPAPAPKAERPAPNPKKEQPAPTPERTDTAQKAERPRKERTAPEPAKPAPKPEAPAPEPVVSKPRAEGSQAEQTEAFLRGLLEHMGVHADMEITTREGGGLDVQLSGPGIGAVIGRRGETLDAIQHLTNYAVNRGSDHRDHINVDAENYRAKREESLVHLAEKMAAKAVKYKRAMALEPMNSYERHVIHTALQDYEGVTTSSIGTEPNRRVVVSYVQPDRPKKEPSGYKEWC